MIFNYKIRNIFVWRVESILTFLLDYQYLIFQDNTTLANVDKVTEFYFGSLLNMNKQNIHNLIKMRTDATFAYSVHDFVTRHLPHTGNNTIFQYLYSYEGNDSYKTYFLNIHSNILITWSVLSIQLQFVNCRRVQFHKYFWSRALWSVSCGRAFSSISSNVRIWLCKFWIKSSW